MLPGKKIFIGAFAIFLSLYWALLPALVLAQSVAPLVPCGYAPGAVDARGQPINSAFTHPCGFSDFIKLVGNVANYFIILGAAFSAIAFGWAGFLMMTAAGETAKIDQAKAIFTKVLVGFLIMLSGWLIVHAIEAGFVRNGEFKSLLG